MCRADVQPEAAALLADVLSDICAALCPDDPDSVVVGPVDFGHAPSRRYPPGYDVQYWPESGE